MYSDQGYTEYVYSWVPCVIIDVILRSTYVKGNNECDHNILLTDHLSCDCCLIGLLILEQYTVCKIGTMIRVDSAISLFCTFFARP